MKSFLKIIAIVLAIIAIMIIAVGLLQLANVDWAINLANNYAWTTYFTFGLSGWQLIALGIAGLVLAAVMSPDGFRKVASRVTQGLTTVTGAAASLVGASIGSVVGGLADGLFSNGSWLWVLGAGAILYAVWPSSEERSIRAREKAELRAIERAEIEARIAESEYQRNQSSIGGVI